MISLFKKYWLFFFFTFYSLYLLVLIFRSSFIFENVRYFSLFDDEMVSMRYAHNLASGFGLIWNSGGLRVEGFTNPLWVLYMTGWHLLHIPLAKISLVIQLTGAVCMVLTTYLVYKIASLLNRLYFNQKNKLAPVLALLFTATYFPLINWNVIQGTEGALLTVLLVGIIYLAITKTNFNLLIYVLIGIGFLTRMDFLVVGFVLWIYLLLTNRSDWKKHLFIGGGIIGIFIASLEIARCWYYYDLLPNTYYLKLTGYPILLRILRGIYVTLQQVNILVFAIAAIPFIFKKTKELIFLGTLVISAFLYSMYVGGDAWEFYGGTNRYTTIVMPLFFILLGTGIALIKENMKMIGKSLYIGIIIVFISLNATSDNTLLQMFFIKAPITAQDNAYNTYVAKTLGKITTKDAVIAVAWAGVTPYFAERTFVDLLGKNDKLIAHEQAKDPCVGEGDLRRLLCFKPGHMKWDYAYTIGKLQPDIIMQAYPLSAAKPYLDEEYIYDGKLLDMYMKKGSPYILYNR